MRWSIFSVENVAKSGIPTGVSTLSIQKVNTIEIFRFHSCLENCQTRVLCTVYRQANKDNVSQDT